MCSRALVERLSSSCFRTMIRHSEDGFTSYLIYNDVVTGRELCMALYDQGVLAYDES